jgi:hypothetical protein
MYYVPTRTTEINQSRNITLKEDVPYGHNVEYVYIWIQFKVNQIGQGEYVNVLQNST